MVTSVRRSLCMTILLVTQGPVEFVVADESSALPRSDVTAETFVDDGATSITIPDVEPIPRAVGPHMVLNAIDADGSNWRKIATVPHYPIINSPEVSPDGEWVGVDGWTHDEDLTDAHIVLIHLKTGAIVDLGLGAMPSWSADGKWIAYSRYGRNGEDRGVFVGTIDGTKEARIDEEGWAITWSPDGRRLAYVVRGDLMIVDLATNERHLVFDESPSPFSHIYHNPKWSPDSRRVAFLGVPRGQKEAEVATVSAEKGDPDLQVYGSGSDFNPDIGWSKDDSFLVLPSKAAPGKPGQLWKVSPEGREVFPGQPADRHNGGNGWSPNGKTLYFVSSK